MIKLLPWSLDLKDNLVTMCNTVDRRRFCTDGVCRPQSSPHLRQCLLAQYPFRQSFGTQRLPARRHAAEWRDKEWKGDGCDGVGKVSVIIFKKSYTNLEWYSKFV